MSTISNLNQVVQQGNNVQEVQHARQHSPEQTQMVVSQQQAEKEAQERLTVQQSGETEKSGLKRDGPGRKRLLMRSKRRKKGQRKHDRSDEANGHLLDTVA